MANSFPFFWKDLSVLLKRTFHPFFWKERSVRSFEKNVPSVLLKRMFCFGRSFFFFWKEGSVPAVIFRSYEKNVPFRPFFWKERNVFLFMGRTKTGKERTVLFEERKKERNVLNGKEWAPIPAKGRIWHYICFYNLDWRWQAEQWWAVHMMSSSEQEMQTGTGTTFLV